MFELIRPDTQFDFVGKRKLWMGLSITIVVGSIVLLMTKGLNYGIDFTGGAEVQLKVPSTWDTAKLREELAEGGISDARVQQIGLADEHQFLVKVQADEAELNQVSLKVESVLAKNAEKGSYEIQRVDVVGPAAGSSLRMSGILSAIYAILCILIYVTIRFGINYSPGAVLALFHNTIIIIGFFIVTQKQFDLQILAAILALIGYTNNDSVVIFDRVREVQQNHPNLTIHQAVNRASNEALGRTILTGLTAFFSMTSLWLLGGDVIENFALTLMIGIIISIYSSLCVASSLVVYLTEYQRGRSEKSSSTGKKKKTYAVRPEPKFQ